MKMHRWRKVGKTESPCKAAWEISFFHLSDPSTSFLPSSRGHFSFFKSYHITYFIPQDSSTNQLHFCRAKAGSSCCCLPSNTAAEECKHGCCMCSWQRGCDMCRTPSFALMGNKILKCHASSFYQPVSFQRWN